MNGLKQYAVFVPNKEQKFMSELTDTNMETETSLLYTREGFEALLASGKVKVYNIIKINQMWLVDKGAKKAKSYTMRIRSEQQCKPVLSSEFEEIYPQSALDRAFPEVYTHTVKHKLTKSTSLEVNTGLSKKDYEIIANHYIGWCEEVNKTRVYLACESVATNRAIVTMDIYSDDLMRLEIELTNAKEGIIIPEYLYTYASHPED